MGLCINALQALQEGGNLEIGVVTETRDGNLFHGIRVANDGPPIPPEQLERIFDPFFSTKDEGTGLGLSVAWRIISSHGGRLEVESSTSPVAFHIWLPAWRGDA
ncbi:MAG: hypothetical protein HN348_30155 [Proteobacteria bacterium]|nr:hypothetical protein [Pseudomonadota bacterium]